MPSVIGLLLKAEGLSDDLPGRSVLRNGAAWPQAGWVLRLRRAQSLGRAGADRRNPLALAAGRNHRRAKTWPASERVGVSRARWVISDAP